MDKILAAILLAIFLAVPAFAQDEAELAKKIGQSRGVADQS